MLLSVMHDVRAVDTRDYNGQTPLHHAALSDGTGKFTLLLLEGMVSINARDTFGFTPIHLAILYQNWAVVLLLLRCGANWTLKD